MLGINASNIEPNDSFVSLHYKLFRLFKALKSPVFNRFQIRFIYLNIG